VVLAILLLTKRKFLRSFTRSFEAIARRISEGSFEFVEELERRQGKCGVLILSMDPEDRYLDLKIRK
jgi:hypothetical protein